MHQRPQIRRRHRHCHSIQRNPHRTPIQLARFERQLRERLPDYHRPRRAATTGHKLRRVNPVVRRVTTAACTSQKHAS